MFKNSCFLAFKIVNWLTHNLSLTLFGTAYGVVSAVLLCAPCHRTLISAWKQKKKSPFQTTQSLVVGMAGFEPTTPCPPDKCATRLRYIPFIILIHPFSENCKDFFLLSAKLICDRLLFMRKLKKNLLFCVNACTIIPFGA